MKIQTKRQMISAALLLTVGGASVQSTTVASGTIDPEQGVGGAREAEHLGVPLLGRFLLGRLDARAARRAERALFVDGSLVTEERVRRSVDIGRRPEFAATFLEIATELGHVVRGIRPGWRRALLGAAAQAPKPTLVVWGERDLILPVSQLRAAARELPHVTTHVFGRAGHMPQIEVPGQFAAVAREWLSRSRPR